MAISAILEPDGAAAGLAEDVLEPDQSPAPHERGQSRYGPDGYDVGLDRGELDDEVEAYTEAVIHAMDPHAGRVAYEPLGTYTAEHGGVDVKGMTTAQADGTNAYTLDATYDDPEDLLYAGYHEALHGVMNNVRREQNGLYGVADEAAYTFLAETLVPALSDRQSYEHGRPVADELLAALDADDDLEQVFHGLDDDYVMAMVQFDVDAGDEMAPYDVAVMEADEVEDIEELYEAWEDMYGLPVDAEASYEVAFAEADTELLGELTERFVDTVDERYAALYEQDAVLPPGARELGYDVLDEDYVPDAADAVCEPAA